MIFGGESGEGVGVGGMGGMGQGGGMVLRREPADRHVTRRLSCFICWNTEPAALENEELGGGTRKIKKCFFFGWFSFLISILLPVNTPKF